MATKIIKSTAVIGAGTMGSQIAALIANSNTSVLLLDIVPAGTNDRNKLASEAIEKLKKGKGLLNEKKADHIQPGNMEDDLEKLSGVDWVIECVPEKIDIKHETYNKIGSHIQKTTLVSSNTSTIPLAQLRKGLSADLQKHLCITHFFNPPTIMPLLELVTDQSNNPEAVNSFIEFADRVLGKNVIHAKDTPGFIGNRIGMFWILCAMEEAKREGVSIPMADSIMNGAFGFPKTGIFALADLIGLKIIPDIAGSMCKFLHKSDAFQPLNEAILPLIEARIKAQGGFYKKTEKGGKQALDLKTGKYEDVKKEKPVVGDDWQKFLGQDTPESRFAKATLTRLLGYTAAIAPDIADSVLEVDGAMRDGFGWKFGPFQIIDKLTPTWLLKQRGVGNVLPLLEKAKEHGFYTNTTYLDFSGQYKQRTPDKDKWTLALKTNGKKPVLENDKAKLWDIGDGITCFEITTKMHVINQDVLDLLHQAIEKTEQDFAGLVVGHDDKNFSGGLDLNIALKCATDNNWEPLESVIKQGQDCMMRLKYARIPSVVALCGYAVGGACEMTIHSTAAQCHIATRLGLVETSIGVVPAWGGTTEHLVIALRRGGDDADAVVKHAILAFQEIAAARKTKNAEEAFTMELIKEPSGITMNRERLLPDAKALCLKLSDKYEPKKEMAFKVPVDKLYVELTTEAERIFLSDPKETLHQRKVLQQLAELLSGYAVHRETGNKDEWQTLTERDILKATCKAFMTLAQEKESQEEIRKVLGK